MFASNSNISGSAHCSYFHSWKAAGLVKPKVNFNRVSEQTDVLHFISDKADDPTKESQAG